MLNRLRDIRYARTGQRPPSQWLGAFGRFLKRFRNCLNPRCKRFDGLGERIAHALFERKFDAGFGELIGKQNRREQQLARLARRTDRVTDLFRLFVDDLGEFDQPRFFAIAARDIISTTADFE